jgi:hypothetical protein
MAWIEEFGFRVQRIWEGFDTRNVIGCLEMKKASYNDVSFMYFFGRNLFTASALRLCLNISALWA